MAGAALCGLALLPGRAGVIVPLALLGLGCAVLYPALLKRYGLGDLLIILAFGIGLTVGTYGVQEGALNARQWGLVSLVSLPVCLLVDAILHANNLRDSADDRIAGVRTLATLLSPAGGRRLQQFLVFGPVALSLLGVALGLLPVWSLATLLALPILGRAYRTGLVPLTAQAHLAFGLLYTLAFVPGLFGRSTPSGQKESPRPLSGRGTLLHLSAFRDSCNPSGRRQCRRGLSR